MNDMRVFILSKMYAGDVSVTLSQARASKWQKQKKKSIKSLHQITTLSTTFLIKNITFHSVNLILKCITGTWKAALE